MTQAPKKLPPLIAIIGCDGSGKSTVSEEILDCVRDYGPAVAAHLGKQQGNTGRWFARLPLVGNWFEGFIGRKAATVHSSRKKNKAPDLIPGLVMYAFTIRRVRRFKRMHAKRAQGFIVIADRFPQLDIPSAFDGPDLSTDADGHPLVQRLAEREQRAFEWMTTFQPDLVVRLNVDLDTACARKPDHKREALARKIGLVPQFTLGGADIVEVNANETLPEVLSAVREAVTAKLDALGLKRQHS